MGIPENTIRVTVRQDEDAKVFECAFAGTDIDEANARAMLHEAAKVASATLVEIDANLGIGTVSIGFAGPFAIPWEKRASAVIIEAIRAYHAFGLPPALAIYRDGHGVSPFHRDIMVMYRMQQDTAERYRARMRTLAEASPAS